jgi:hypothetical protein
MGGKIGVPRFQRKPGDERAGAFHAASFAQGYFSTVDDAD